MFLDTAPPRPEAIEQALSLVNPVFLNTPQFAEPGTDLTSPSFAQITNTLNEGRTFQFQLRFRF